jgi:hypothetical protein
VAFSFASKALEIKSPILATICGMNAATGSQTNLQEQQGTLRVWRSVAPPATLTGNQCKTLRLATPNVGRFFFRLRYWVNGRLIYTSPMQGATVYGPVSFVAFCNAVGGCNLSGGTTEIQGHLDSYIYFGCQNGVGACGGQSGLPVTFAFASGNSCRSLSMTDIMQDGSGSETPGDQITITVVQHTLNQQTASVDYDQVSTATFELDGGPLQVQATDSTQNEFFYLLSAVLDCYTPTGQN